ncbi:MAG TPA: hypothetical protein VNN79_25750 [Actinomycetota bacterium]|nr:hypothetical protein [Actinomycetota bacterium]
MTENQDDLALLQRAEEALTEIKVSQGLSDRHASVLAALRIRLKGTAGKSLDEMLEAAGDLESGEAAEQKSHELDNLFAKEDAKPKQSLDDLFAEKPKKPEWPS